MTRDMVVFVTVLNLVGYYGFYLLGYEKGTDAAHKDCPHVPNHQLKFIEEQGGTTKCTYANLPAFRRSVFARRAEN